MKVFLVMASANVPQTKEIVLASPPISEKKVSSEYDFLLTMFTIES